MHSASSPPLQLSALASLPTVLVKHWLEFMRRPRKQEDESLLSVHLRLQELTGCAAQRIMQNFGCCEDISLAIVVGRHLHAPGCKPLVEFRDEFRIALQFHSKRLSYALSRQIVLGWSQP